jgi:outer membrane protein assembly factor BamB
MKRFLPLLILLAGCKPQVPAPAPPADKDPTPAADSKAPADKAAPGDAPKAPAAGKRDTWSDWRGPAQNGWSPEHDLPEKLSLDKDKGNLSWTAPGYGGLTTPIVQNGRVYIIGHVGNREGVQERVACFDEKDGHLIGEQKFNVFLTGVVEVRVGWTSLAGDPETGNVYAHATSGMFYCFDQDLKKILWSHSLTEEYGRVSGYGGRLNTPIVDGDLVIIGMLNGAWGELAIGGNRWVAFNKRTGDVVWWGSTGIRVSDTYASSPVVAVINGERLLISGGFAGVYAFKIRTGELAWGYEICHEAVNLTPVVDGTLVYIGHGEENPDGTQGSVVCLDASQVKDGKPKLVWRVDGIKAKFASPVVHDGRVYVCNDVGQLTCLDAKTGDEKWTYDYGRETKGSPVMADGKIYIAEANSNLYVLKPGDTDCTEVSRLTFESSGAAPVAIFGTPSILHGRIFLMTGDGLYCFGKKDYKATADPLPPEPKETPAASDAKLARIQVVPADVTVAPGDALDLKAYAFDAHGEPLGEAKVDWALGPMHPPVYPPGITPPPPLPGSPPDLKGALSAKSGAETKLTVAGPTPPLQFGTVEATLGDLKAHCRVRVAPKLPFIADFSKVPLGRTPAAWVNTQGKFSVIEGPKGVADHPVFSKRNNNPNILVARANAYIGAPTLSDYTIDVDEYATKVKTDLSDMGCGNSRYEVILFGNDQKLRLSSWSAQGRIEQTIPYDWKPDTWYHVRLKVHPDSGNALVQAKVWPRDDKEPEKWTLEVTDAYPNTEGAPFLYGYSVGDVGPMEPGTAIYYDNLKITPNSGK